MACRVPIYSIVFLPEDTSCDHFQGPSMITQTLIRPLGLCAPLNHTITLDTDPGAAFIPAISEQPQTEHCTKRKMGFLSFNISLWARLFSCHGPYTKILTSFSLLLSILLTLVRMGKKQWINNSSTSGGGENELISCFQWKWIVFLN